MGETKHEPSFMPGTLDMLVLKTVSRGAMHGYSIAQFIQDASRDVLRVEEGALYPALHRLEVRGLLRSEWGTSDNNRRAKFYRLTALGRRELDNEAEYWTRIASAVTRVMQTA
ncbi:MAG: PadR family transcriptional regulator [Acidobacteria bacterium]|nr:MAG: PadR family transcriptional regulator [Acidobacteriota bacterium]PYR16357.1 MAG: PadR family transcriptional regulator [Acidobacteriota bacterium]PYR39580.1 MAG: PadR family transcriptional regulator [Acidobacteriota bacterium]